MSERVRRYLAGEREVYGEHGQDFGRWFTDYPATHRLAGQSVEVMPVSAARGVRVGSEREGWRARLANIERLLSEALEPSGRHAIEETVGRALAEVRSMIDGNP